MSTAHNVFMLQSVFSRVYAPVLTGDDQYLAVSTAYAPVLTGDGQYFVGYIHTRLYRRRPLSSVYTPALTVSTHPS